MLSEKLVCCNYKNSGIPEIVYQETNPLQITVKAFKSAVSEKEMQYNEGDYLKFTATYDKFSTVLVDVPIESKEIIFNLVACTDASRT